MAGRSSGCGWTQRRRSGSPAKAPRTGALLALATLMVVASGESGESANGDVVQLLPPQVLHVDLSAPAGGDGLGWLTAHRHLQDALADAASRPWAIAEIRVAAGTHRPDRSSAAPNGSGARASSFALVPGVPIRGGFAGFSGADPDLQDPAAHPTLLSGDLLGNDGANFAGRGDNAFHVVTAAAAGADFALEGVVVAGGNAQVQQGLPSAQAIGAGVLLSGGTLRLDAVTLRENSARNGGGLHVGVGAAAVLEGCQLLGNRAIDTGGGGFADGSLTLLACAVEANVAIDGAGVAGSGTSSLTVVETGFVGQRPYLEVTDNRWGGGVYAGGALVALDCQFVDNAPFSYGGGLASFTRGLVQGCTFVANYAAAYGGGVYRAGTSAEPLLVVDSLFLQNGAGDAGGGMMAFDCNTTVLGCRFELNAAIFTDGGGLMMISPDSPSCPVLPGTYNGLVAGCSFVDNTANREGGGLFVQRRCRVRGCDFTGNVLSIASSAGGAGLRATASFPSPPAPVPLVIEQCRFTGNTAQSGAGAIAVGGASSESAAPRLSHLTIVGNASASGVGGLSVLSGPVAKLDGCILWGNTGVGTLEKQQVSVTAATTVSGSCVQGLATLAGNGNIGVDPLLVDPLGPDLLAGTEDDDLRPRPDSPCIDVLASSLSEPCVLDLDGRARSMEVPGVGLEEPNPRGVAARDMGAYEHLSTVRSDCDLDWRDDGCAVDAGLVAACLGDGVPSGCLILAAERGGGDCDLDGVPDVCEIDAGSPDCDADGVPDSCAIDQGLALDCDDDGMPDACAIGAGLVADCNGNGRPDDCDVLLGISPDLNDDGQPDECADCDGDGASDLALILLGALPDCDANNVPDGCDIATGSPDSNGDGVLDACLVGDLDGDGDVDGGDLGALLLLWGPCSKDCPGDLDRDRMVGGADLALLLGDWT